MNKLTPGVLYCFKYIGSRHVHAPTDDLLALVVENLPVGSVLPGKYTKSGKPANVASKRDRVVVDTSRFGRTPRYLVLNLSEWTPDPRSKLNPQNPISNNRNPNSEGSN